MNARDVLYSRVKLFVLMFVSVFFVLVRDLYGAITIFVLGLLVFILTKKSKTQIGVSLSAFVTGGMILIYNVVFSPVSEGGRSWLIFTVNSFGLQRGLVMGLRIIGVMLMSFSWLFSTSLYQIYQSLCWIKPVEPWLLSFLRGVQIFRCEIQSIVRSLLIRGLRWDSLINNVKNLMPLASVVIPRSLNTAQESTLAYLTHKKDTRGKNEQ